MKINRKRLTGILLTLALLLGLLPGMGLTALAADNNPFARLVNTTARVTFNNHAWHIIENESRGVNAGTVTLLAADTSFGTRAFDEKYESSDYGSSTIKGMLDAMTAPGGSFADVATAIADTEYGKLYLLSADEAKRLSRYIRKLEFTGGDCKFGEWWLRSPGARIKQALFVNGIVGQIEEDGDAIDREYGVRPALKLNLSSVDYSLETRTFTVKQSQETISPEERAELDKAIQTIADAKAYYDSIKDNPEYADAAAQLKSVIEVAERTLAGKYSDAGAVASNDGSTVSAIARMIQILRNALQKAMADVAAIDRRMAEEGQAISIAACEITVRNRTYTGKPVKKPAVTVMYGEKQLKEGTDYTLAYDTKAKEIGAYRLKVRGMGQYTGTKSVTFKIIPKGTAFTEVTGGNHQITLKWKKQKNITGYQLQYGREKDFSDGRKITAGKGDTSATIKKLEAGKTYYVRIRTYATVEDMKFYSEWSEPEAVKTGDETDNAAAQGVEVEGVEGLELGEDLSLPGIDGVIDGDIDMDGGEIELVME